MKMNNKIISAAVALSFATSVSPTALMAWDAKDDAEAIFSMIEDRAEGKIDITYSSAKSSRGDVIVSDLKVVGPEGEVFATANTATFGNVKGGTPSSMSLNGLNITADDKDSSVSIDELSVSGAGAIQFLLTENDIESPFSILDAMTGKGGISITGLNVQDDDDEKVSLESLKLAVDGAAKVISNISLSNLSVEDGKDGEKVNISSINFGGMRYGAIANLIETAENNRDDEAGINAAIDAVADGVVDVWGVNTLNVNNVTVNSRRGQVVTVGEIALDNLKYHKGALIGADFRVTDTGVRNTPEAAELGMEGFVVDMFATSGIAADGKSVAGKADITLRDGATLQISQSGSIDSLDSYIKESGEIARNQVRMALRSEFLKGQKDDSNPLAGLFVHDKVNMTVKLTDLGVIAAAISKQAEQTGQSVDMLAMQVPMMLPMVLNGQLPEDQIVGISTEITEFLKGSPLHVAFETVDGWQEKIQSLIETGNPAGLTAKDIVSVSFPAD